MSRYDWETYDARDDDEAVARLLASPRAAPTWERDVALAAIRLAGSRLALPDRIRVVFHLASDGGGAGAAEHRDDGDYVMHLALYPDQHRDSFAFTVFHECRHIHDYLVRRESDHYDRIAWELDADDFAREMLAYFTAGTVPPRARETRPADVPENQAVASAARTVSSAAATSARAAFLLAEVDRRLKRLAPKSIELRAIQRLTHELKNELDELAR